MNRPLALIEGDLALPIPRPFEALPPPFGSRRRQAQTIAQREPQPVPLTAAQQAIQDAVQHPSLPARRGPLPPGVKFLFFYKLPAQPDHSHRFAEQLAEAGYYLKMGQVRPRSTRSDHVLGAAIFAGCSIALAWLLATCTTHDVDRTTAATTAAARSITQPVASADGSAMSLHPRERAQPAQPPVEFARTIARSAPLAATSPQATAPTAAPTPNTAKASAVSPDTPKPQHVERLAPHPTTRVSTHQDVASQPAKPYHRVPITHLSKPRADERLALSRTAKPSRQPSTSQQPDWTVRSPSATDTAERAALLDWATQQRRANITTRARIPVPKDTDWSAHLTQRRITDNPEAFGTSGADK
ncbi:hypothetical protein [Paraburkholderia sediminicola]|uniref:hypothetical protein n=1 Tax=Paraburkholderia sediminicola TaxID=458836 RepID=UPI0038BD4284